MSARQSMYMESFLVYNHTYIFHKIYKNPALIVNFFKLLKNKIAVPKHDNPFFFAQPQRQPAIFIYFLSIKQHNHRTCKQSGAHAFQYITYVL